jgi:hypothetical protein
MKQNYLLRCSVVTSVANVFLFKTNSGPFFSEYQIDFLYNIEVKKQISTSTMVHVMKKKTSLDIEYFLLFCDELSSLQIINHFIRNILQKMHFFWKNPN